MTSLITHHHECQRRIHGPSARCNCNPVSAAAGILECPANGCVWSTPLEATAQSYRNTEAQFRSHLTEAHDGATFRDAKRWHAESLRIVPATEDDR